MKPGFVLSLISSILVLLGINPYVNALSILFGIVSLIISFAKKEKNKRYAIGLSIFGIAGSITWLVLFFVI